MSLLKDGYSYQWKGPGWIAGPIFLVGGALLLGVGAFALDFHLVVLTLGALATLFGLAVTLSLDGLDYAPLKRTVTPWSRRWGVRKARPPIKLEDHWVTVQPRPGSSKTSQILLCSASEPSLVLLSRSTEQASTAAASIARALKLELRDSPAP